MEFELKFLKLHLHISNIIKKEKVFIFYAVLYILLGTFSNLFFLGDYGLIPLRDIDELAFHVSVDHSFEALKDFNFAKVFKNNDYVYGNIFWLFWTIVLTPFKFFESHSEIQTIVLLIPRMFSLIFVISTIFLWNKICDLLTNVQIGNTHKIVRNLFFFSIPTLSYSATKFHPNSMLLLTSALALYFSVKLFKLNTHIFNLNQLIFLSSLFTALTISIKINGIIVFPLILYFVFSTLLNFPKKLLFKWILYFISFTYIFMSPLLLLDLYFDFRRSYIYLILTSGKAIASGQTVNTGLIDILFNIFNVYLFNIFLILIVLALLIFSLYLNSNRVDIFILKLYTSGLVTIVFFIFISTISDLSGALYVSPILFILVLPLHNYGILFISRSIIAIFLIASLFNYSVSLNLYSFNFTSLSNSKLASLFYIPLKKYSNPGLALEKNYYALKEKKLFSEFDSKSILIDYRAVIPVNPLNSNYSFSYIFNNELLYLPQVLNFDYDYIVLSNQSKNYKFILHQNSCLNDNLLFGDSFNLCRLYYLLNSSNLCNDDYCYKKIYSDQIIVLRKTVFG
jgi:hypothetical protein